MAKGHKRANKRKAMKRAPATQHLVVDQANVTVTGLAYEKFKGWVPLFTGLAALSAAIVFVWNAWTWLGLPKVVAESTFHDSLQRVQTDFSSKIGQTKEVVIEHSNKNTAAVKDDVSKIVKRLDIANIEALKDRVSRLFQQKTEKETSLSNIEGLLAQKNLDQSQRTNLIQRRAETNAAIKWLDNELTSVQARLQRAEQGQ